MSPEGTPIQVNANVLQAAASHNATGRLIKVPTPGFTGIVNTSAVKRTLQKIQTNLFNYILNRDYLFVYFFWI